MNPFYHLLFVVLSTNQAADSSNSNGNLGNEVLMGLIQIQNLSKLRPHGGNRLNQYMKQCE